MSERIAWQHVGGVGDLPDHLETTIEEHVTTGLIVDDQGHYKISWLMYIDGTRRSLPEVEDFIRRVARFMEQEPVIPEDGE